MSETTTPPVVQDEKTPDRDKILIVVLTVVTTVLAAILAALQADASIRADTANRDSQYLAILVSGELQRTGLEANYEFTVLGEYLKDLQEATVLQITALEQEQQGDEKAAQSSNELAAIAQSRADMGVKFSVLFSDPRYAPTGDDFMPNAEQYLIDTNQKANDLVVRQNAVADEYARWNRKADSYVTALTILAVAFFLFGLAQAVKNVSTRLAFAGLGLVVVLIAVLMSGITLLV